MTYFKSKYSTIIHQRQNLILGLYYLNLNQLQYELIGEEPFYFKPLCGVDASKIKKQ